MGPGSQLVHSQAVPAALGLVHPRQAAGYGNHIFDTNALDIVSWAYLEKLEICYVLFLSWVENLPWFLSWIMHVVMACDNFVGLMAQETISWAKPRCSWRTFTYKGTLFLALAPQKSSSVKCAALAISLELFPLARSIVTGTLRNLIAARAAFSLIVTVSPKMVSSKGSQRREMERSKKNRRWEPRKSKPLRWSVMARKFKKHGDQGSLRKPAWLHKITVRRLCQQPEPKGPPNKDLF